MPYLDGSGDKMPNMKTIKAALIEGFTEGLGITAEPGEITDPEEELAKRHYFDEIGTDDFVAEIDNPGDGDKLLEGSYTGPGGTINTFVKLEGPTRAILQRVLITGDFFVTPPRVIFDLEASLAGARLNEVDTAVQEFFETTDIDMLSVGADDFVASINDALAKREGA